MQGQRTGEILPGLLLCIMNRMDIFLDDTSLYFEWHSQKHGMMRKYLIIFANEIKI